MKIKVSRFFHAWVCLAVVGPATAQTYLAEGPYAPDRRTVVLFHFDEAAGASLPQDSSFNALNPYSGPLATGDAGVFGNAMAFTNNLIEIAHDAAFLNIQSNGFFECWIKPSADYIDRWGSDDSIINKNAAGSNRGDVNFGIRMNPISYGGGQFFLLAETGAGTYRNLQTPNMITESRWYHVRVQWDCVNKPTIHVDGVEKPFNNAGTSTDTTYVGPYFNVNARLAVGVGMGKTVGYILLDELRLCETPPPPATLVVVR
ncbi:MAG: LamG-like jellyroll fold domain-containing protein [Kiritimatiellia bacterium]|jgi:hypothetical protein